MVVYKHRRRLYNIICSSAFAVLITRTMDPGILLYLCRARAILRTRIRTALSRVSRSVRVASTFCSYRNAILHRCYFSLPRNIFSSPISSFDNIVSAFHFQPRFV